MDCQTTPWPGTREFLAAFGKKVWKQRVPICGGIDLTSRCNLKCIHCYAGPRPASDEVREMTTGRILSLIDEAAAAGCLFLTLTGGEPLLRPDFSEVYRHAKYNGLLVTLFTNATLLTSRILDLLAELPPYVVEVSLYGATSRTYEGITGVAGSYDRCLQGIAALTDRGISLRLKTVLMTRNIHELDEMERMAHGFGVDFRFDAAIFPRLTGDRSTLALRVAAADAVRLEMADGERLRQWREYCGKMQDAAIPGTLYKCGAGRTSFHIDADGYLMPCLMSTAHRFDVAHATFHSAWARAKACVEETTARLEFACNACNNQVTCGYCPAFFMLENGAEDVHSPYLCAMGAERLQHIYAKEMA